MPRQMPSTGRPAATRSRSASARPSASEPAGGALRVADAGDHGERRLAHGGRVGGDVGAAPGALERRADAAQVAGAVVDAATDFHSAPFVERLPAAVERARLAQRAADAP